MNNEVLKDSHKGERCFLLGSGPSLNEYDLSKLYDEHVFATLYFMFLKDYKKFNHLYLSFSSRFPCNHGRLPGRYASQSLRNRKAKFLYRKCFEPINNQNNIYPDDMIYYLSIDKGPSLAKGGTIKTDITKPITMCGTIVADFMLPVIHYMGFDTVYVLGCDCTDTNPNEIPPHFYDNRRMPNIVQNLVRTYTDGFDSKELNWVWSKWRDKYNEDGIKIYNVDKDTNLNVLDRIDYETIFNS